MTKTIDTLVEDIYAVVEDRGGWDETVTSFLTGEMHDLFVRRLQDEEQERGGTLRMSNIGSPCKRKLWYHVHRTNDGEALPPTARLKFLFGDMLEVLLLSLATAAGHRVEGMQDELQIAGVVGHRDAVIDGITVDIKSASPYSFAKFSSGSLRGDDPFGYISQLSSYVYAGREQTDTTSDPNVGAFLVINKVSGEICLDKYDFTKDLLFSREEEFEKTKTLVNSDTPPDRGFEAEPDGYKGKNGFVPNGNEKLCVNCSYCEFKELCWPGLRTFMYRRGNSYAPTFFSKIVKEPNVMEAK